MSNFNLIRKPVFTEKSNLLKDGENQYVFKVHPQANKIQIKKTVERAFKVSVLKVRTMNVSGRKKRLGRSVGKTSSWKKAIVTLQEGQSIEYFGTY